jgi:hypothetical protein
MRIRKALKLLFVFLRLVGIFLIVEFCFFHGGFIGKAFIAAVAAVYILQTVIAVLLIVIVPVEGASVFSAQAFSSPSVLLLLL